MPALFQWNKVRYIVLISLSSFLSLSDSRGKRMLRKGVFFGNALFHTLPYLPKQANW